ncbi:MAG: hypothetical protein K5896_11095 [Prevotella sp.]|nr:hypothetical protein [Prevotella sp.]
MDKSEKHSMQRRSPGNNYTHPGIYHITITINDRRAQSLGRVIGDVQYPDEHPNAPKVELTAIGKMVENELLHSISHHYPFIEVQDYVIMPEHLHFILNVKNSIISKKGRITHLGQVIAGFKAGCNRRYWDITGQKEVAAKPQPTKVASSASSVAGGFAASTPVLGAKKQQFTSGRQPLFSSGYVDVIPLQEGQLETQRAYIRANPRNRLLRTTNRADLFPQRRTIDTLVTLPALKSYLIKEYALSENNTTTWEMLKSRLMVDNQHVTCDSYGPLALFSKHLLPVVCHRRDKQLFSKQKTACLDAAAKGAILVSPRIASGEQEIMDEAITRGFPVMIVVDNGFPVIYHPSEARLGLCASGHMLLVTPWSYQYRPKGSEITVAECKTMNCIAQALCHTKDNWWKQRI